MYAKNVDLNTYGRSWTLTVGGGGYSGMFASNTNIGSGGALYNGSIGGRTSFKSNINSSYFMDASGGNGGATNNNFSYVGTGGTGTSNLPNTTTYTPRSSNSGSNGGGGGNGVIGGNCVYNSATTNYNSAIVSNMNLSGSNITLVNNYPGLPAGGDSTNSTGTTNQTTNIVFYRNGTLIKSLTNYYGSGGGGAGGNNTNSNGNPGGPGGPGFAIIYYYL